MTVKQISKKVPDITERTVRKRINKLYAYGFLEIVKEGFLLRKYRIKLSFIPINK